MNAPYFIGLIMVFSLLLIESSAKAAFPVQVQANVTATGTDMPRHLSATSFNTPPATPVSEQYGATPTEDWMGVAALVLGIASLLFIVAAALTPIASALWLPSVILAIVFGGIGLRGKNRSMARAGMIIGIVEVGIVFLFAILAIVALANYK
jgi:hypothetical protein